MIEFLLKIQIPDEIDSPELENCFALRAMNMADQVQAMTTKIFASQAAYEVHRLDIFEGQSTFSITAWVVDNTGELLPLVIQAQEESLAIMQKFAYGDETVHCSWQIAPGKSGGSTGLLVR